MFGKEKKPRKPKSKARRIVEWVLTGVFAALLVGVGVLQIINKTSKNQNMFGPQFQKVLTDSLRSMEEDGIITRTVYPEVPPHVEYALSELGESMRPIIQSMEAWGTNYKENM